MDLSLCSQDSDLLDLFAKFGNDQFFGSTFLDRFFIYGNEDYFDNYVNAQSESMFAAAGNNSFFLSMENEFNYIPTLTIFNDITDLQKVWVMGKMNILLRKRKSYGKCEEYLKAFGKYLINEKNEQGKCFIDGLIQWCYGDNAVSKSTVRWIILSFDGEANFIRWIDEKLDENNLRTFDEGISAIAKALSGSSESAPGHYISTMVAYLWHSKYDKFNGNIEINSDQPNQVYL